MCDYSLMGVPNRLASEGEALVVHRFRTGSIGLTSKDKSGSTGDRNHDDAGSSGFWSTIKAFFQNTENNESVAVCIPPGARLLVEDIPEDLQQAMKVGVAEEVVFTQISADVNAYRDAIRLRDGREILLQRLQEGLRIKVLKLSLTEQLTGSAPVFESQR